MGHQKAQKACYKLFVEQEAKGMKKEKATNAN